MGAFYLYKDNQQADIDEVTQAFTRRGFTNWDIYSLKGFSLLPFSKILLDVNQVVKKDQDLLYVNGTMTYKGMSPQESMTELLEDVVKHGSFSEDELIGHFIIILYVKGSIKIITDKLCTMPLYYTEDETMISNSFYSLLTSLGTKARVSQTAIYDILFTGGIVPPITQVEGIFRWVPSSGKYKLGVIDIHEYVRTNCLEDSVGNFNKAIDEQISRLDNYFSMMKPLCDDYGVTLGLTGGFDSRLLLCFLLRHEVNVDYYTHWQGGVSKDYNIGKEIADNLGVSLNVFKQHKKEQTGDIFQSSYLYNDCQIRTQSRWDEVYGTIAYYQGLNLTNKIGLNGVGGEQYRNSENIHKAGGDLRSWIKKEILHWATISIDKKAILDDYIDNYFSRVSKIIQTDEYKDMPLIKKKYYNEVYGYSVRYYRSGFGNQIMYHLSPFSDPHNSLFAYRAVPHLGGLYDFQMMMIKLLNPQLAKITSSYGFSFSGSIPYLYKTARKIQSVIPKPLYNKIKSKIRGRDLSSIEKSYDFASDYFREINLKKLSAYDEIHILLAEIDYFISKL